MTNLSSLVLSEIRRLKINAGRSLSKSTSIQSGFDPVITKPVMHLLKAPRASTTSGTITPKCIPVFSLLHYGASTDQWRFIFSRPVFLRIIINIHIMQEIPAWKTSGSIIAHKGQRIITVRTSRGVDIRRWTPRANRQAAVTADWSVRRAVVPRDACRWAAGTESPGTVLWTLRRKC